MNKPHLWDYERKQASKGINWVGYCGWIKLHRKGLDSGLIKNHKLWVFWTWCLLKATHKKTKQMVGYQMVELEPGQFIFGRKAASEELEMSEQTIRTCLQHLKDFKNITVKSTNKFSIITVVNWHTYQQSEEPSNQQVTSNQPATNQQVTTNKNVKNVKNVKKKDKPPIIPQNEFNQFWLSYPKKKSKGQALKTWNQLEKTKILPPLQILLDAIAAQKAGRDWQKQGGKYIPYPSTWLNAYGWNDEVASIKPQIMSDAGMRTAKMLAGLKLK